MPPTRRLRAESADDVSQAAFILRAGGTVAFPTETVYGLGANALDQIAVAKVFTAKQRPSWDPLIVHISSAAQLSSLTQLTAELALRVAALSEAFWPGPLTLLLPKKGLVPDEVTAGRHLVGIRVPAHPTAQALLREVALPIAAPSANTFGYSSPTTAEHVLADLDGRINAVLDGGPTAVGVESTVIDPCQTPIVLYRPGAVTARQISEITGVDVSPYLPTLQAHDSDPGSLPSPGVGIRHYAPRAKVILVSGGNAELNATVRSSEGKRGVLLPDGWTTEAHVIAQRWGSWHNPGELAAMLFAGLRALDDCGVEKILCPLPEPGGLNDAIRDRLFKSARPR